MNWWVESWKSATKTEIILMCVAVFGFLFLDFFTNIPKRITEPFYYAFACGFFIYLSFFKKKQISLNHQLYGALIAGLLLNNFIRSISTFIAQLIIRR